MREVLFSKRVQNQQQFLQSLMDRTWPNCAGNIKELLKREHVANKTKHDKARAESRYEPGCLLQAQSWGKKRRSSNQCSTSIGAGTLRVLFQEKAIAETEQKINCAF